MARDPDAAVGLEPGIEDGARLFRATYDAAREGMRMRDISNGAPAGHSARFYARLLQEVGQAVVAVDLDGRIIYWNRAASELFGWTEEEILARSLDELLTPQEGRVGFVRGPGELSGGVHGREALVRDRRGRAFLSQLSASSLLDEVGARVGTVLTAFDLTARKQLEEVLRESEERFHQAQKMEPLGRLAGGIAHDFNNILTVIKGYCEMIVQRVADDVREDMREVLRATERATALASQLLAFSRKEVPQARLVSLGLLTAAMRNMLQRLIGEDIDLRIHVGRDVWLIRADPVRIEQVIMNLAVNARDAMPHGGALMIATDAAVVDRVHPAALPGVPDGEYVVLTVRDTGVGMSRSILEHIFEPFFTTKEKGKGTGLGLATVNGIVKQCGGFVQCASAPGEGTTFTVCFPRCPEETFSGSEGSPPSPSPSASPPR